MKTQNRPRGWRDAFRLVVVSACLGLPLAGEDGGFVEEALAAKGDCGQPESTGGAPVTKDSLSILKSGVGLVDCELCVCDVNDSGTVSSTDALIDLKHVVGQPVTLGCPPCATTTTTSSTTTTLADCDGAAALDNLVFNEIYTCVQHFSNQPDFCADYPTQDAIRFHDKGGGILEARDEPDSGFVYSGPIYCTTWYWNATSPDGYTEQGIWEFGADHESFAGHSNYVADNLTYAGYCDSTGAKSPTVPPDPPLDPLCQ